MIRNLSLDIFAISYMLGYFKFVPDYILLLIIIGCILDAIALYLSQVDLVDYYKNPTLKKMVNVYLDYSKPKSSKKDPIWFFLDRFVVGVIFLLFIIYYFYKHGICK